MQFVPRSACPKLLAEKQAGWTAPWLAYYHSQGKKPSGSHWLLDDIRLSLIKDFHNNCGYCGQSLPTPQSASVSKGDVDHYLPKKEYPDQVYEWTNYVWSCKPCNGLKWRFNSVEHPLLNPCCKEDCAQLQFVEDTGKYVLKDRVTTDAYWQQRLSTSEQKTCLNADEVCQKRRSEISALRKRFESIAGNIDNVSILQHKGSTTMMNIAVKKIKGQIRSDLEEILVITSSPEFYFLLQERYQRLRKEYQVVAELIDQKKNNATFLIMN